MQSCSPHGILSIFQVRAHLLIALMISIRSSPLSVRVYSHLIGNEEVSTFFLTIPSSSSSLSRSERIFGVISSSASFSSENLRECPPPLYSSRMIRNVHFLVKYFTVWLTVQISCTVYFLKLLSINNLISIRYPVAFPYRRLMKCSAINVKRLPGAPGAR